MNDSDKDEYENILVLNNIVEANHMDQMLKDENLSFYIRLWQDVNFDGIFVEQSGYAVLLGRKADEEAIRKIYADCVQNLSAADPGQDS